MYKALQISFTFKERMDRLSVNEESDKEDFGKDTKNEDTKVYDTTNVTCNLKRRYLQGFQFFLKQFTIYFITISSKKIGEMRKILI